MQDDIYYEKYLKYKAKYMALKNQEGGVLTMKNGIYVFFCNEKYTPQICAAVHGNSPSNSKLNEILSKSDVAYRAKKGDSKLELVSQSKLHQNIALSKESLSRASSNLATNARALGSSVATGARNAARNVGSSIATGARNVGSSIATGARNVGSSIATGARNVASNVGSSIATTGSNIRNRLSEKKTTADLDELDKMGGAEGINVVEDAEPEGINVVEDAEPQGPVGFNLGRADSVKGPVGFNLGRADSLKRPVLPQKDLGRIEVVKVSKPVDTSNEEELKNLILKLQKIDNTINNAVIIEIKTVGSNKCLGIVRA